MTESLTDLCKRLEHFETPKWAAKAILSREILTASVFDPCCGCGVLMFSAKLKGYNVAGIDIHNWDARPRGLAFRCEDYLAREETALVKGSTVFMNPPFSKACEFVEKSFELGARKIVCFQRFAWLESRSRREFWEKYPPNRVYICGDRAPCWRHDIPEEERASSAPTAHAWFVWEQGAPAGTLLGHIWKDDA